MADLLEDAARQAFERRVGNTQPSRLLFKRGGSVFAEKIAESEYVDSMLQQRWREWLAAWTAAVALERAPKTWCCHVCRGLGKLDNGATCSTCIGTGTLPLEARAASEGAPR